MSERWAEAATKPKEKKSYTTEENRGGHFFSAIKMRRILHEDGGRTIFNKQMLTERFFENLADEERPEPEALTAEIENELANDLEDDLDDGIADDYGDDLDDGMLSMMSKRPGAATNSGKSPTPYKRIREKRKRHVQRKIETLQKCNIGIEDTDELGNTLDEDALNQRKAANRSAERWYVAALQRQQVVIDYTTPGEPTRPRHLAALSTMFHREENSIYLLGSEKTATGWGAGETMEVRPGDLREGHGPGQSAAGRHPRDHGQRREAAAARRREMLCRRDGQPAAAAAGLFRGGRAQGTDRRNQGLCERDLTLSPVAQGSP